MAEFDPLCEVQSDKATVEVTSRYAGVVVARRAVPGDLVQVGGPLVDVRLEAGAAVPSGAVEAEGEVEAECEAAAAPSPAEAPPTTGPTDASGVLASPAVRRVARELGVDLASVPGSGPGGRVLREDVDRACPERKCFFGW